MAYDASDSARDPGRPGRCPAVTVTVTRRAPAGHCQLEVESDTVLRHTGSGGTVTVPGSHGTVLRLSAVTVVLAPRSRTPGHGVRMIRPGILVVVGGTSLEISSDYSKHGVSMEQFVSERNINYIF